MKSFSLYILIYLLALFTIQSCNNTQSDENEQISTEIVENPNSASGNGDFGNLPVFQFDKEEHDFGKIVQGVKVSYSFRFKNTGNSDLLITKAKASCGCTNLIYPKKPIPSGKEGTIKVTFDSSGRKGFQNKVITLIANTQPNTKVLKIQAQVVLPE
ncbi:DUF1573 domain-containing protein [Bacteroidota bacterium]